MGEIEYPHYDIKYGFNISDFTTRNNYSIKSNIFNKDANFIYESYLNQSKDKMTFLKSLIENVADNPLKKVLKMIGYAELNDSFLFQMSIVHFKLKTSKWFIRNGIDVTCKNNLAINYVCDSMYYTKDVEILKLLLESGADPRACDDLPICLVSKHGNMPFAKILIEAGADVAAKDNLPICLLSYANIDFIQMYINNGADITCRNNLPIVLAIRDAPNVEKLKYLVSVGADPLVNENKILKNACENYKDNNNISILEWVLDLGIDVNLIDKKFVLKIIKKHDNILLEYLINKKYNFECLNNGKEKTNTSLDKTISLLLSTGMSMGHIYKFI